MTISPSVIDGLMVFMSDLAGGVSQAAWWATRWWMHGAERATGSRGTIRISLENISMPCRWSRMVAVITSSAASSWSISMHDSPIDPWTALTPSIRPRPSSASLKQIEQLAPAIRSVVCMVAFFQESSRPAGRIGRCRVSELAGRASTRSVPRDQVRASYLVEIDRVLRVHTYKLLHAPVYFYQSLDIIVGE
ncbi:MAG: hypothetical protein KAY11_16710 [Ilumatobacteraceae bacterium]|nr:hypothetical protein [Ilumatobacteraceae bacterium]